MELKDNCLPVLDAKLRFLMVSFLRLFNGNLLYGLFTDFDSFVPDPVSYKRGLNFISLLKYFIIL